MLHPADVRGRFMRWRRIVFAVLIAIYPGAALHPDRRPPGGAPRHRRRASFYLFGARLQRAGRLAGGLRCCRRSRFGLLFVTALARARAGAAGPARRPCSSRASTGAIERVDRGSARGAAAARCRRRWSAGEGARAASSSTRSSSLVSLIIAHVFAAPTSSRCRALVDDGAARPARALEAFVWRWPITAALYFNFAWFREQLCIVICPYGRLQSVLHRHGHAGHRLRHEARRAARQGQGTTGAGDCVDCGRCVAVCPTGIDIRNGLQMECIGCAQCIDACDEVMDKLGPAARARPLRLAARARRASARRRLRPRLVVYGALFVAALAALVLSTAERAPFEATLLRGAARPSWSTDRRRAQPVQAAPDQQERHARRSFGSRSRPGQPT